jgi:hypothetical protein
MESEREALDPDINPAVVCILEFKEEGDLNWLTAHGTRTYSPSFEPGAQTEKAKNMTAWCLDGFDNLLNKGLSVGAW